MGLSYEVLGLFSAGLTLLLAVIRAIWVHYRGTPSNGNDIEAKRNEASILRHFLYRSETNKLILKL
jgi:hypothetical protein